MHVILTGATGLVGSSVLEAMIKAKDISKISILSRKPVKMAEDAQDPRINVIIHKDFEKYDSKVLEQLRGASACVWALGISQTQVGKEEYVRITKDFTMAAATSFASLPSSSSSSEARPFRFIHVSGEGATQTPGLFTALFGRIKGETESLLADLMMAHPGRMQVDSVRPAFVDSSAHQSLWPYMPAQGMLKKVGVSLFGPVVRVAVSSHVSPTPTLGDFLTQMAMGKVGDGKLEGEGVSKLGGSWIVGNVGMRRIMGL